MLRKFARAARPSVDVAADRAELLDQARNAEPESALLIARHLSRLRNFSTATTVLDRVEVDRLPLADQSFVGVTQLNARSGLESDQMLVSVLSRHQAAELGTIEASRLGEWIALSGLAVSEKLDALASLRIRDAGSPASAAVRRALRFRGYQLRKAALYPVDPLEALQQDADPYQWKDNLRYLTELVTHGHREEAVALLSRQIATFGWGDRAVLEAALRFENGVLVPDLAALPSGHRGAPGVLALAYDNRAAGPQHQQFYESCLAAAKESFPVADVFGQDALLRVLTVKDLLQDLEDLVPTLHGIPDTLLGARCGRGLLAMEKGAHRDAAGMLESVLEEDPGFTAAATGLRFIYARLDGGSTVIDLRNRIGYGAASAGRPGIRLGDRDQATTLLLEGEYLRSWSVRRAAPPWRILKRELGERFLNYEPLPVEHGTSLFLIIDDGVGDEIRTAQFYHELSARYDVTATCDPRLRSLLERSFPRIRFIDVPRRIRGTLNPVYDGRYSDFILASHVPAVCDAAMAAADHVTFGQNLTFNRFAGLIPRQDLGAYLVPDPARTVPRSAGSLKVGLVWKSHFAGASRRMMYLGIEEFDPLLSVEGVEFWSVQHAASPAEAAHCAQRGIRQIEDVDLFDDLEGLAGHLASMDLVIGISTVPMELAAALGTRTWLLGFSPENRLYRTAGGRTETDQLSRNSTVIAPPWIDFTRPYDECVELVMEACRARLEALVRDRRALQEI